MKIDGASEWRMPGVWRLPEPTSALGGIFSALNA
jgi:hypothetical protein